MSEIQGPQVTHVSIATYDRTIQRLAAVTRRAEAAEQQAAAWQDAADDLTERLSAAEQQAAALDRVIRTAICDLHDPVPYEIKVNYVIRSLRAALAASGGAAPAEQAGGE